MEADYLGGIPHRCPVGPALLRSARPWGRPLTGERVVRRLAAILAADVVGYSRRCVIGFTLQRRRPMVSMFWPWHVSCKCLSYQELVDVDFVPPAKKSVLGGNRRHNLAWGQRRLIFDGFLQLVAVQYAPQPDMLVQNPRAAPAVRATYKKKRGSDCRCQSAWLCILDWPVDAHQRRMNYYDVGENRAGMSRWFGRLVPTAHKFRPGCELGLRTWWKNSCELSKPDNALLGRDRVRP